MITKKIIFSISIMVQACLITGCDIRKSNSIPTHEDTLWVEKIDTLRGSDDIKACIKELKSFLATPRQHTSHMDLVAMEDLAWKLFCNNRQGEAMQLILQGDSIAHKVNDNTMQATFLFYNGRYIAATEVELGRKYMLKGIDMMKQCLKNAATIDEQKECARYIVTMYRMLIQFVDEMSASKEMVIMTEYENSLSILKRKNLLTPKSLDHNKFSFLIAKLRFCLKEGKRNEAEDIFRQCKRFAYAKTRTGKAMLDETLVNLGHYREAIRKLEKDRLAFKAVSDSLEISSDYCDLTQDIANCYDSLGMKEKASEYNAEAKKMQDALTIHRMNQELQHLGTEYEVQQRQYQLDEEQLRSHISLIIIVAMGLCLFMAIAGYTYYRHISRILKTKNKLLTENVLHQLDESKAEQTKHKEKDHKQKGNRDNNVTAEDNTSVNRFIKELTDRKLFCNVNFDRDALLDELNIPRRSFPHQFEVATGKSTAQYILTLRLEYAADLIRQKPEYTIDAIAQESGFSGRSTFYRNFANQFGITPTEYRDQLAEAF